MKTGATSRRAFLTAGLALPLVVRGSKGSQTSPAMGGAQKPLPAAAHSVQYRTLGRTGLKLSTLGFGCMLTSDPSVLQRAAELGINYFDTARVYQRGNNEHLVGAALKSQRKKVVLASKTKAPDKAEALQELEESLRALETDYLDIWYLHDKRRVGEITEELVEAQAIAKKQGKIRFAGVSLHSAHAEIIPAVIRSGKIDVVLVTYNFATEGRFDPLIRSLDEAGIGIIAMKVMAGAFGMDPSYDHRSARERLKRPGAALAALKYVLQNRHVHSAIPSMVDMDQLDENMKAMGAAFTEADRKILAAQLEYIRPLYCRMCGQCEGSCPQGLPVADILRCLSYAEGYGQYALGREHFMALPAGATDIRCNLCPSCAVNCPHGVHVAQRLSRAQELFT